MHLREVHQARVSQEPACRTDSGAEAIRHDPVPEARGQDDFDFKMTVLKEMIEHHVDEEEKEFFPRAEKALGAPLLEELCVKMEARFEEAKAEDFRGPLHENLRQVLEGVLEPTAAKSAKKPMAKKTAKKHSKSA